MTSNRVFVALMASGLALGAAGLVGCGAEEQSPQTPQIQTGGDLDAAMRDAGERARDAAEEASERMDAAAAEAGERLDAAADSVRDAME
jgi:hypothetical protein